VSEVLAYCEFFKIEDLEYRGILLERIKFMDDVLLGENRKKEEAKNPPKKGKK